MDTKGLLENLRKQLVDLEGLPWMSGNVSHGSFRPEKPPSGSVTTDQIGKWLWVKARLLNEGTTMDQTTDRLSGDPYEAHVAYDWIGLAESAPSKVSHSEELEEWAQIKTEYACEYTDVGLWGVHEGVWVEEVHEDGIVSLHKTRGRFQDETPESTATVEQVKLK